jgi:K+-transporting ATPase KdpF subunit
MVRAALGKKFMGTLIVGLISLALLVYLFIAMLWPEKFFLTCFMILREGSSPIFNYIYERCIRMDSTGSLSGPAFTHHQTARLVPASGARRHGRTWLDPIVGPLERLTYRLCGVDPNKEQHWKQYTISMLIFSLVTMLVTYAILRLQASFRCNTCSIRRAFSAVPDHLAFNTAASFTTNTNWQSYGGESTMSYLSQMVALASQNFFSAAVGIAIAAALVRGIARHSIARRSAISGSIWSASPITCCCPFAWSSRSS